MQTTKIKWIKTSKVEELELSRLCLGGGKMTDMSYEDAHKLVINATTSGINIFDAHHRYGNCEWLLGKIYEFDKNYFGKKHVMTKISAYLTWTQAHTKIMESLEKLGREPTIYWVSDLDNDELYKNGEDLYNKLRDMPFRKLRVGITTESAELGRKFMLNYPECNYFMIPLHICQHKGMFDFAREVKNEGKHLFIIKPFNDGRLHGTGISLIDRQEIRESFEVIMSVNPDVICFGTKDVEHLKETIEIFNEVCDGNNKDTNTK